MIINIKIIIILSTFLKIDIPIINYAFGYFCFPNYSKLIKNIFLAELYLQKLF